ncbi:unnamed protein product, partial [Rotaria sp. Silwood2]
MNQNLILKETEVPPPPPSPPVSQTGLENILHELDPLTERIEHLSKLHYKRYNQLLTALEDQINAIRILQERSTKAQVKVEYAQTIQIPSPTLTDRSNSSKSSSTQLSTIRPIEPKTHVYAVWDDDGLVYE